MFFLRPYRTIRMIRRVFGTARERRGITILIVVLVLTAILSISAGVLNVVIGQLTISGQVHDSFRALYAADEAIEKWLFLDRVLGPIAPPTQSGPRNTAVSGTSYSFTLRASPTGCTDSTNTMLTVSGQDTPLGGTPHVKRGFQLCY